MRDTIITQHFRSAESVFPLLTAVFYDDFDDFKTKLLTPDINVNEQNRVGTTPRLIKTKRSLLKNY